MTAVPQTTGLASAPQQPPEAGGRLLSLDVVRGLIVLLMLFVNDMPGVTGAPAWLEHIEPPDADGMTLPDFVFPCFLFIVGLSIPFAIETRLARGATWPAVWRHVLGRTASLLLPTSRLRTPRARISWALLYGACLLAAALLLHTLHGVSRIFIYNKIASTPPTGLLTAGLASWLWALVYLLVDVRGWRRGTGLVASAGRDALFIYILGPMLYYLMWWSPVLLGGFELHSALGSPLALGLLRATGFTLLVVWLAQVLRRAGLAVRV